MKTFAFISERNTVVRVTEVDETDARQMMPINASLWMGAVVEVAEDTDPPAFGDGFDWQTRTFSKGQS